MRSALRAFPTLLKIGFAELAAYRGEVLIWIFTTTMPLIMYAMWATLAAEAPVGRFDEATFAAYFLSTLVVRQLSASWIVWELNYMIRTGAFSPLLLRPIHPLWYFSAQNLGAVPFRILVLIPVVAGAMFFHGGIHFSSAPVHILLFIWTTFLAWALTFLVQSVFGLLALYTEQSLSFQDAWFGLWALFSGYLIPLSILPGGNIAVWLPFRAMGSLPTEIILGHLEGSALLQAVALQLGWTAALLLVAVFFWGRALRRFEAYGG